MGRLRNALIIIGLSTVCSSYSCAQKSSGESKYIHPLIETDSAFGTAVASQEYVVVDFWAIWCRPCQMFLPEYEQIAKKFHKRVAFYKLNADKCPAAVSRYEARMLPVVIVFKAGKEEKRYTGLTAKERIIFDLEEMIKNDAR